MLYSLASAKNLRYDKAHDLIKPYEIDNHIMRKGLKAISHMVEDYGYLDYKLRKDINEVRNYRNFAAHYFQRLEKELSKVIRVKLEKDKENLFQSKRSYHGFLGKKPSIYLRKPLMY